MDEIRIEFTITRRRTGEDDFTEIGFGSSGACSGVEDAAYAVESAIQNRRWEIREGMPRPAEIM